MHYTFKSKVTGDLLMMGPAGDEVLRVIGMAPSARGILPAADMPAAVQAIEAAIAQEHTRPAKTVIDPARDDDPGEPFEEITFQQHVWPFVEMLKRAQAADEAITWGV
jgi:hypothetical protein